MTTDPGTDGGAPALLMPVAEDWYALDLALVREVIEPPIPTRVPSTDASVLGVINVRGSILAVLDTAVLLGLPALRETRAIVVVHGSAGLVGLAASGVPVTGSLGRALGPSTLPGTLDRHHADVGPAVRLDAAALLPGPRTGA